MVQHGLKRGTFLKGTTYRIENVLGQGSFGITYLATAKFNYKAVAGGYEDANEALKRLGVNGI